MYEEGDLLIGDMEKNCTAWEELGGKAIIHRNTRLTMQLIGELS
jgi:hypothetical protein